MNHLFPIVTNSWWFTKILKNMTSSRHFQWCQKKSSFGWKIFELCPQHFQFQIQVGTDKKHELVLKCTQLTGIDVLPNDLKRPIQDSLQHLAPVFQDTSLIQELALNKSATAWQPQWLHCIYIGKTFLCECSHQDQRCFFRWLLRRSNRWEPWPASPTRQKDQHLLGAPKFLQQGNVFLQ